MLLIKPSSTLEIIMVPCLQELLHHSWLSQFTCICITYFKQSHRLHDRHQIFMPNFVSVFHKWSNMVKCYRQFIFAIIERIKLQISSFCHFCHQKREFDVILMYNTRLHVILFSAFMNLKNASCKTHHARSVHEINIKFVFLMTKATKCWHLHVDTFNNIKYKFLVKLIIFLHSWKNWDKISLCTKM